MRWGLVFRAQQYLKNSLWVIPFLGGVVGVILAQVGLWLDTLGFLVGWTYSPETATAVVSATISAVASLTGFVVTVTVLGVQMATGTFSPRYMRMWYRDGRLKLLLAVLVGTLMFSFFVMRQIQPDSVPDLSVSLTNGGVALALLLFVLYFDRFVHRMRPVAVAAYMADEGRRAFEEWLEDASRPDTAFLASGTWRPATEPVSVVRATRSGTIQALHMPGLTRFARDHACTLVFRHGVGDFVPVGATLIEVHGDAAVGRRCASPRGHGLDGRRADDRAGPGVRDPGDGRRRDQGAVAGRQRPVDGGAGPRPPRRRRSG